MAAVFSDCGALRYVRSAAFGPQAQRLISTPAAAMFAHRDLKEALLLAVELRFQSACRILSRIRSDFLDAEERRACRELLTLFQAYGAWDAFHVRRFLLLYATVEFGLKQLEPFRLSEEGLAAGRALADAVEARRPSRIICVDLYNSARRRRRSGAYHDAIARLYRAMELLAQERLLDGHGVDADNVDAHRVPPRYRPDFEALRSPQDGRIRLGLRKTYELLYRLEDPLGLDFEQDPLMPARLDERRPTMLAHGVDSMDDTASAAFFAWVTSFFERHIENFARLGDLLQFPWLRE
jgi:hypothetical protein